MQLTQKDKSFIEALGGLLEERQLRIELVDDGYKRFVLRQNYGDRIQEAFGMTRQGVRWRFQRLFNDVYVEAYERILWIESNLGTQLRASALAIARERTEIRRRLAGEYKRHINR